MPGENCGKPFVKVVDAVAPEETVMIHTQLPFAMMDDLDCEPA
jgi:hypothetical protein